MKGCFEVWSKLGGAGSWISVETLNLVMSVLGVGRQVSFALPQRNELGVLLARVELIIVNAVELWADIARPCIENQGNR